MSEMYRRQGLVEAPIEDVWAVVSDPRTHPEWWPDVDDVRDVGENGEYIRTSKRLGYFDQVDAVWVAERVEHLHEAHFRCTISGSYAHFQLTPARDDTFVDVEMGMLPTNRRWALMNRFSGSYFTKWLDQALSALPHTVSKRRLASGSGDPPMTSGAAPADSAAAADQG